MIHGFVEDRFRSAFNRSLLPGEVTVELAWAYSWDLSLGYAEPFGQVHIFNGLNWFMLGLTNSHLRIFSFQETERKVGILKTERTTEVTNMSAVPLHDISVLEHRYAPEGSWPLDPDAVIMVPAFVGITLSHSEYENYLLTQTCGPDFGELLSLRFQTPNGPFMCNSPYNELASLKAKLAEAVPEDTSLSQIVSADNSSPSLATLHDEGVLTEEEFSLAQQKLAGTSEEDVAPTVSIIRQLYSLSESGVLSESEFKTKKMDVLSRKLPAPPDSDVPGTDVVQLPISLWNVSMTDYDDRAANPSRDTVAETLDDLYRIDGCCIQLERVDDHDRFLNATNHGVCYEINTYESRNGQIAGFITLETTSQDLVQRIIWAWIEDDESILSLASWLKRPAD